MSRYDSQMILPEIGEIGQARLKRARLLVVGAGGLGSTLLPILVMDDDVIEEANLYWQTLYSMEDIGRNKAIVAVSCLKGLEP